MYDAVVVGGGPAGLTAAIYLRRAGKSVLIVEKDSFGGQMTHSPKIENYPGFASVSGLELADKMFTQAVELGAEIELDEVTGITSGEKVLVGTASQSFEARTAIIAAGARHRTLNVPGEADFEGDGVSYCAVCDGAFYAGQSVAVVGGGNSALQEAVMLSEICNKVTILQDLPFLTGEDKLRRELEGKPNVEVRTGCRVLAFEGKEKFEGVRVLRGGSEELVSCDGAFVAVGLRPDNGFASSAVKLDGAGYVESDESCLSSAGGVFAAGDCRTKSVRQIATAIADGAAAAVAALRSGRM